MARKFIIQGLENILILLFILGCQTPYLYSISRNYHLTELMIVVECLLGFIVFLSFSSLKNISKRLLVILNLYLICIICFFILRVDASKYLAFLSRYFFTLPILTYIFYIYIKKNKDKEFFYKFSNWIILLSIMSLFFWWFGSVKNIISPTGYFYAFWGSEYNYTSYYGLYFERQYSTFFGNRILRNDGMFCEAPMFSLCLTLALGIELFLREKYNNRLILKFGKITIQPTLRYLRILILILTQITTMSTTGLILTVVIFVINYFITHPEKSKIKFTRIVIGIILGIVAGVVVSNLYVMKSDSISWLIRLDDFLAGFLAWMNSPILGNGYGDYEAIRSYMAMSMRGSNDGFSNSVLAILSQGGLLLFSVFIIPMFSYLFIGKKYKNYDIVSMGIILIMEFIVTFWQDTFLIMVFLAYGYALLAYKLIEPK